jgi:hypothetical protein
MCGGGKTPEVAPLPDPSPVPTPSQPAATVAEGDRINKIKRLQQGLASTIKTNPQSSGAMGAGPELTSKAGTMFDSAAKTKLGA